MNELQNQTITDCVIINTMPLMIKEYNNRRVVTFKDIDTLHQRPEGTARKRFNDNKSRFIEGEDYFKTKCYEVRPFFGQTLPNGYNPNGDIILVTESGYLMLTKSLTDDLAWKVQRELVNTYFRARDMFALSQSSFQTLLNKLSSLETEIADIKHYVETNKTMKPNFWVWKRQIAGKVIDILAESLNIDSRTAYDMVYDNMASAYGFNKSLAISQFCVKYGMENTPENPAKIPVIDTIADMPEYQRQFVETANHIINCNKEISCVKNMVQVNVSDIASCDKVQQVIMPLIHKYEDNSPNGSKTYRTVYKKMNKTDKTWKNMLTRHHCKSKKELLLKCDKYYAEFVQVVNDLLSEGGEI